MIPAEHAGLLQQNAQEVNRIDRLLKTSTLEMLASTDGDDQALHDALHANRPLGAGSTLANLSMRPSRENVHEWDQFKAAFEVVLKRAPFWKKLKRAHEDILKWHMAQIQKRYYELVDQKDDRVMRMVGTWRQQRLLSHFIWDILTTMHNLPTNRLDDVARTMIGDYKRLSLNPTATHRIWRPKAKPKSTH